MNLRGFRGDLEIVIGIVDDFLGDLLGILGFHGIHSGILTINNKDSMGYDI